MRAVLRLLGTLLIIGSVVGLALLAAGPPSSSPEAAPTTDLPAAAQPVSTPGPPPTQTDQGVSPAGAETPGSPDAEPTQVAGLRSGRVMLDEEFVDNRMQWPSDPESTAWVVGPGYRLVPRQPTRFVAVGAPIPTPLADVVVTATFRKLGGPSGGGYGLIVRDQHTSEGDGISQAGHFYVLEVGDRGEIGIWRRDDDHWVDLLTWTQSDAVHQGNEPNTLEVWAIGQRLTLLVNGTQAASQIDPALSSGGVGVFAGGDGNDVQLDRLIVRVSGQPGTAVSQGQVVPAGDTTQGQSSPGPGAPAGTPTPSATAVPSRPITRVVIPDISLDAPTVAAGLVKRAGAITWDVPPYKIGHAQETAGAGDAGNAVLVGHVTSRNLGNVFEHLHEVGIGDTVQIFSNERQFNYRVVDVRTVARTDVSVVQTTVTPSVTLITCSGLWLPLVNDYSERRVVRAELVSSAD
jgi:LPXTG-site transpeptidase (sortase) family protein